MGLFDYFKKKEKPVAEASTTAPVTIDLSKSQENLGKVLIDLSKNAPIDLTKHIAHVAVAMDYSGSMETLFRNGSVQEVMTRLLPIALKFDDNGELESWLFSNGQKRLESLSINNYKDYVRQVMQKSGMSMGGTNYAPVLEDMVYYYKDAEPSDVPAFIIFITDGENWDEDETTQVIREISEYNMFIQFVGIGDKKFNYLKSLDDLLGRKHDNTGFIAVEDMNKLSDQELYTELLRQYTAWLNNK